MEMSENIKHPVACWLAFICSLLATACVSSRTDLASPDRQILFVCEHGNVKSLMAASYFNEIARSRGLPYRAISRGSAPNSDSVPTAIVADLRDEGFDVSSFRPIAVGANDVSASERVVLINTALPTPLRVDGIEPEQWNDVPPASVDYAAASAALRTHVSRLIDDLARSGSN